VIAELRLLAKVVVRLLVAKVAAEPEPVQVYEPLPPPLTLPHEKMFVLFVAVTEKGEVVVVPGVVSVTNTVLVLVLEVMPAAAGHIPSALLRLPAKVVVLLLVAKVPAVELGQVLDPRVPAVTLPHENVVESFEATLKVVKLPGVVSVTVSELPLV
jgi:hypothetical protein